MNFKVTLSSRISMDTILKIVTSVQNSDSRKQELFDLLFDEDDRIAYNAGWVMTHFSLTDNKWLYTKQDQLIDEVFVCKHSGKRRLILTLLYRQPLTNPPRVDFLDFCLEGMMSHKESPGSQSLCLKLAYELCRTTPELCQELCTMLDIMQPSLLPPALSAVKRNTLKAMKTGKSLQSY